MCDAYSGILIHVHVPGGVTILCNTADVTGVEYTDDVTGVEDIGATTA